MVKRTQFVLLSIAQRPAPRASGKIEHIVSYPYPNERPVTTNLTSAIPVLVPQATATAVAPSIGTWITP